MPDKWSQKDERMYKKIRKNAVSSGKSSERASEMAARTVNKKRQSQGRTENRTPSGTGNPNQKLEQRTFRELYNRAQQMDIRGRSKMNKNELVRAIRND